MFDLLTLDDFFDDATRGELLAELRDAPGGAATIYGHAATAMKEPRVRSATRVVVSPATRARVLSRLRERQSELAQHFGVLVNEWEEPQFLRYETGDFFVAHQDGNTPLIRDQTSARRVSIVIFLNAQSRGEGAEAYGGGELVMQAPYPDFDIRKTVAAKPGSLVAFRSETTHEVLPVTSGQRFTIVSWYR